MTASGFERVREVVMACLDMSARERAEYLGALSRHEPELASAARRLIGHDTDGLADSLDAVDPIPTDDAADELPDTIGVYRIRECLGAGGMGVVYVGVDPTLDREVAVKVVGDAVADADAIGRFREEARLLARVSHPHIATVHSFEEADGQVHLTMELVRGRTLAERLRRGPLPVDEALAMASQLASALDAAHGAGVVHRDLKPSNVMVSERHGVKVLDFGLATIADGRSQGDTPGDALGTPGYMSPEQIRGEEVDPRTDVWAFGCVVYECLVADPLFGGLPPERMRATLEDEPDTSGLGADVPDIVRELVRSCVARSTADRPSASELRQSLDAAREVLELSRLRRKFQGDAGSRSRAREAGIPFRGSRFVGREDELAALDRATSEARWVSVVGLGGVGKSRLVAEFAERAVALGGPVVFVDAEGTSDRDAVPGIVLDALRSRRVPTRDESDQVVDALADGDWLIVVDGIDAVRDAVAALGTKILGTCDRVRFVVAVRDAVGVEGERHVPVRPMPCPEALTPDTIDEVDAVSLFVDRARAVAPSFAVTSANATSVLDLCRRLDGLPLAIECAAALAPVLTPSEILARVERRLGTGDASGADVPGLAAVFDDVYAQLTEAETSTLRRLSVFRAGFSLIGAERVVADDAERAGEVLGLLSSLIRRSLVVREEAPDGAGSRYRLLDTVRDYAHSRLCDSGELDAVRARHLRHLVDVAAEVRGIVLDSDQERAMAIAHADMEDVRTVVRRAGDIASGATDGARREITLAARVTTGFAAYWIRSGRWAEGRRLSELAKAALVVSGQRETESFAQLGRNLGELTTGLGDLDAAREHLHDALGVAESLVVPELRIGILNNLGTLARRSGALDLAIGRYEEAIAIRREHPDDWDLSGMLNNLAVVHAIRTDYDAATAAFTESLRIKRAIGEERGIAHALNGLGLVATYEGRFDDARPFLEESLAIKRALDDHPGIVTALLNLGFNALSRFDTPDTTPGLLDEAREWYSDALTAAVEVGDRPHEVTIRTGLAWVAVFDRRFDDARFEARAADEIAASIGNDADRVGALLVLSDCELATGDVVASRHCALAALDACVSGKVQSAEAIDACSWHARAIGDAASCTILAEAADGERLRSGTGTARWRRRRNEEAQTWAASILDADDLARAVSRGRAMEDAIQVRDFVRS